ncbi:MAG: hypothetical protein RL033_6928, partial [Pseudomonadota bacterium]
MPSILDTSVRRRARRNVGFRGLRALSELMVAFLAGAVGLGAAALGVACSDGSDGAASQVQGESRPDPAGEAPPPAEPSPAVDEATPEGQEPEAPPLVTETPASMTEGPPMVLAPPPETSPPGTSAPEAPPTEVTPPVMEPALPPPVTPPPVTPPPVTPPPVTPPPATPPVVTDANLPQGVLSRFPVSGQSGVCTDVPLRLTFANGVTLGNGGSIRLIDSARGAAIASIDMAASAFTDTIAGRAVNTVRPVFLEGNSAVVYFRHGVLQPNTRYSVNVDAGVFRNANGAALGAINDQSWSFTTRQAPAAANRLVVQRESQGDFCTLQGALDAVPANNTAAVRIELRNGTYHEMPYVTRKSGITISGEDREDTVVSYP